MDFLADFQTGKLGQHQVLKKQVGRSLPNLRQTCQPVINRVYLELPVFQVLSDKLYDVLVIFDDENAFHAHSWGKAIPSHFKGIQQG